MTICKYSALFAGFSAALTLSGAAHAQGAWTGPYVGGHLGYSLGRSGSGESITFDKALDGTFNDTVVTTAGANAFSPGFCAGAALSNNAAAGCDSDDDNRFDGGLRAGYDWQFGNWVVGALAEVSSTQLTDSVTAFSTTPASYTFTRELKGVAALRLRAGWSRENTLGYVTGGVAQGRVDHIFLTSNAVNTFTQTVDDEVNGYQMGAGFEAKVTERVSLGLEYLYTSLDDDSARVRAAGPAPATNPFILTNAAGTDFRRSDDSINFSSVRLTASYRFR